MPTLDELVAQLGTNTAPSSILTGGAGVTSPTLLPTRSEGPGRLLSGQPANFTKLSNKWTELSAIAGQIPPEILNALIDFDAERVARGSQPLTREQTIKAAISARDNMQVTKEPKRGVMPWDLPGNAVKDLGNLVLSLPRLPMALYNEAKDLPNIGTKVSEAQAAGAGPLEALASAPGIRMLPGAFIAANLMHPGELARHPLFTALDALPAAKGLAGLTGVAKEGEAIAAAAGRTANPLRDVMTNRLVTSPFGVKTIERRAMGAAIDGFMTDTRMGRMLAETWGSQTRDVMRNAEERGAHLQAVRDGLIQPKGDFEAMLRNAAVLADKHGLTAEEVVGATHAAQTGDFTALNPKQSAFIGDARLMAEQQGRRLVDLGELGKVETSAGQIEFYPIEVATQLQRARDMADATQRISIIRDEMVRPTGNLGLNDFEQGLQQAVKTMEFDKRVAYDETRGVVYTMDAYGIDTTQMRKALRLAKEPADVLAEFQRARAAGQFNTVVPHFPMTDILREVRRHKNDTMTDRLATAMVDKNPTRVTKSLGSLIRRTKFQPPFISDPNFVRSIRSHRERIRLDNTSLSKYTQEHADTLRGRADKLVASNAPARYEPIVGETARKELTNRVMPTTATPEQAAAITQAILEARWPAAAEMTGQQAADIEKLRDTIIKDVESNWQTMQQAGVDPVFVHKTSRTRARTVAEPRIGPVPNTLSQVRERFNHWGDLEEDITVALGHQAMEILNQQATELFVEHVVKSYGFEQSAIRQRFADEARAAALRDGTTFEKALSDIVGTRFEKFDPDQRGYAWGGAKLDQFRPSQGGQAWMIPKALANNLHRMASPKGPITAAFDPITKTFRMSVIGLSPRTHLYNILGGGMMLFGQAGARGFGNLTRAWEMVRHPELITDEVMRASIGSSKRMWTDKDFARAEASTRTGRTMARLLGEQRTAAAKGAAGVAGGVIQKSLDFNSLIDDMYRTAAYLSGYDKQFSKGLSKATAEAAGRELMRKTMMDYTGLTPIERGIFKSVFPFYGFMQHSLRYVTRYPIDHPMRATMIAALGRAEQEDLGALPNSFLSALFVGKSDANRNALNLGGINPFNDVGNLFTIAGFLSQTNPLIATALEQVGLMQGEAELYPTLRYDPASGRLRAQHENALLNFAQNVIPQSAIPLALLGANSQYNEQMRLNPSAAYRSLASSAGLPIAWRNYNVPAEIAKAEVNRQRSEDLAKNAALESGNWGEALRYPGLREYYDQLVQLPPEVLAQFQPQSREAIADQLRVLVAPSGPTGSVNQPSAGGV